MNPAVGHAREPFWAAVLALVAVATALVSQHRFDMQPCPWCVLQRLIFVAGAAVGLVEAAVCRLATQPTGWGRLSLSGLRLALATSGVAAALWQHGVASAQASCNLTLADRLLALTRLDGWLPDVFQPRASCLEAKAWLLGVPYEFWSAALFVVLAGLALHSLRGRVLGGVSLTPPASPSPPPGQAG